MSVPHWIVQLLSGGVPSQLTSPLIGQKAADTMGNAGIDAFLAPIVGAMDATGPKSAATGTNFATDLTGQNSFWNSLAQANRGLQPMPAKTMSGSGGNGLVQMPFG